MNLNSDMKEKLKKIKLVIFDFDGVFTDGSIFVDNQGNEFVQCSHYDGEGISQLKKIGLEVIVLSGQTSPYVQQRCKKMNISWQQSLSNKLTSLKELMSQKSLVFEDICYMGDDLNDSEVLEVIGVPVAVANARQEIKNLALYVTQQTGGKGAIRELCDIILEIREGVSNE